ncbi:MAG: hypothetical protein LCH76_10075 [Actinobacteria bacterium]|nr:hypothetical protein [Actinomycetota bacterium]
MGQQRWEGGTPDDDLAAFEAQFGREEILELSTDRAITPVVPEVPPRPHVDLGIGGSLIEEAARIDASRSRPALLRDPILYLCSLIAVTTGAGIVVSISQPWHFLPTLVVAVVLVVVGGLGFLLALGRRGPLPQAELLRHEALFEQRAASQVVMPPRWRMLYDRVLPGTEHRVPFILVGPAGVVVLSILPSGPYGLIEGGGVTAGDGDLNAWVATRRWEVTQLADHLANHTEGRWRFSGPVYSLALQVRPSRPQPGLMADPPRAIDGLSAVRRPPACYDFLASLPAVLPVHVVDDVEDQVHSLCPLAPTGT